MMPSEDNKILELDHYQKSDKTPFIVFADFVILTNVKAILKVHL